MEFSRCYKSLLHGSVSLSCIGMFCIFQIVLTVCVLLWIMAVFIFDAMDGDNMRGASCSELLCSYTGTGPLTRRSRDN